MAIKHDFGDNGYMVLRTALAIEPGDWLQVRYRSSRGKHKIKEVKGAIDKIQYTREDDELYIEFTRSDGQEMRVKTDGWLYSIGSNFPRTGTVVSLNVEVGGGGE